LLIESIAAVKRGKSTLTRVAKSWLGADPSEDKLEEVAALARQIRGNLSRVEDELASGKKLLNDKRDKQALLRHEVDTLEPVLESQRAAHASKVQLPSN
jgi:hypothetical protein